MNNKLKSQESHINELELKDEYEKCFTPKDDNVDIIKDLISYIQYKYYDILNQPLTSFEIKEILRSCYGIEADERIDLYLNFKDNCNKEKMNKIMSDYKLYEAKGLTGELRKILDLTIEQWR